MDNNTGNHSKSQMKKWRNRNLFVFFGIVISFILLCVIVSVTVASIYGNKNVQNRVKPVYLRDALPKSFGVTFNIQTSDLSLQNGTNDVTVRWEIEPNSEKFQQRGVDTTFNESILTTVNILDHRAVVSYTVENNNSYACAEDLKVFHWFSILRLMMTSVESNVTYENCSGKIWTVPYDGKKVYICFQESQVAYIQYDNKVAGSKEWMVPLQSSVNLPQSAPRCPVNYPQLSTISKFEQENKNENLSRNQDSTLFSIAKADVSLTQPMIPRNVKPECLFVHGIGERPPKSGLNTLTAFPDYWGNIHKNTPQCSSHRFIHFNTVDNGWDSPDLHKMFCKFATGLQTGGLISNKIIFSHSMGNNIIAAAFYSKSCTLDKASSQWFSVSAPWRGSKVVDKLKSLCAGRFFNPIKIIASSLLRITKYCTKDGNISPAFKTLAPSYRSPSGITYDDLVSVAREYVDGALCGTSPWGMGLNPPFSGALKFVQSYSNLETPNDGVVAKVSCDIFGTKFQFSHKSKFFLGSINHLESSAKLGCGWDLCLWYRHL